jgi:signal transduction histidine kinase
MEREVEAPDAWAMVDGDRILQVLANLLSNALKFSPPGERVTLRLERVDTHLRVSVQDRGPGIPAAFHTRLFQKFAQADGSDSRRKGGTGLGLSIARGLVERMGGSLDFVTAENVGTTFRMELPEWRPVPSHQPTKETP